MASPEFRFVPEVRRRAGYASLAAPSIANDVSASGQVLESDDSTLSLEDELRTCPPARDFRVWRHLTGLERIACGAFASVYRASDTFLERDVALKLYGQGKYRMDGWFELGLREARLLARIRHPNVVMVYGADHCQGRLGIWMEYIRGRTLDTLLQDLGPLAASEAALIGCDVCSALTAIHGLGLLHCDITLRNVMRENGGRIVLMDLGLSQDLRIATADAVRRVCGTPLYMAPELLQGQTCSMRSDVYSVGVLLYRLVTGSFPVEADSINDVRKMHERGDGVLLRNRRPDLPEEFLRVVEQALDADAAERFPSAGPMAKALSCVLTGCRESSS